MNLLAKPQVTAGLQASTADGLNHAPIDLNQSDSERVGTETDQTH